MQNVYIVAATRTPIGRFGGAFKDLPPTDLGATAMAGALRQANIDGSRLDLIIFGNVLRAGHGQLLPRQAALKAGIPPEIDAYAIDMVCSSGMMSLMNAATAIKAGQADLILAGGMESMSQAGFLLSARARWGYKFLMGTPENITDILLYDGLTDPVRNEAMGTQSDRLAAEHDVSRAELDEVAAISHQRAAEATARGFFKKEITPIEVKTRQGMRLIEADEGIRPDATLASLAGLRPVFGAEGVTTAGNSSQISDGAAALLLAGPAAVARYNLTPLAKVLGGAWSAGETWRFPQQPVPTTRKLLAKLNMQLNDFDLFENNEAFALNNILFHRLLNVPYDKQNVYGGAVALGHPIGASGARIVVTLLNALTERNARRGLAAICHGVGGAATLAIERV